MMNRVHRSIVIATFATLAAARAVEAAGPAEDPQAGRAIYMKRCSWCHGDQGRGDGASAEGMFPRPRDLVRADYKIRSTAHGQLPTDDDLFRMISRGLPGTPMPGWEKVLSPEDRWQLVYYLKSLSPRFKTEKTEALPVPSGAGVIDQGRETYLAAKCFLCHGDAGRGDGPITTTLNSQWGIPHTARDLTRGWSFRGGHEPRDIYLRITGGLNGTPMGPYAALLTDQERWDLAHYVASLDGEPSPMTEDFHITAAVLKGDLPDRHDAPAWQTAKAITVPLAGQVVLDPPLRWWIPTSGSCTARALHNGREIAFLIEWNDPTKDTGPYPDSAFLQFPAEESGKPYFLFGDADNPASVWHWQAGNISEKWTAAGSAKIEAGPAEFKAAPFWRDGRWHVVFCRGLEGEPPFRMGGFVPILFSVCDGSNAEFGNRRALSTWLYVTLASPPSARPWLLGLAHALGLGLVELWLLWKVRT